MKLIDKLLFLVLCAYKIDANFLMFWKKVMNIKLVVILLAIFGALYYGYPKYQDKKLAEQIRADLKKPINDNLPSELKSQMIASIENNYPTIRYSINLKQANKSDFDQKTIDQMKTAGFISSCEAFYGIGSKSNEYFREMLAKIVKEDNMQITYTVKDKIGELVYEDTRPITDCTNFNTLEAGGIPYIPAPLN